MLTEFGIILLFFIIGILFVAIGLISASFIRPSHPNPMKNSIYECGEEPIGPAWIKFNVRFYVIALAFILFDVEVVFLLPWAVILNEFKTWNLTLGWFAFVEMIVFVVILLAGLAYLWVKGDLNWEKPMPYIPKLKDLVFTKSEPIVEKIN